MKVANKKELPMPYSKKCGHWKFYILLLYPYPFHDFFIFK